MDVRGRTALLIGASGGIGTPTVRAFARAGANLVLSGHPGEAATLETLAAQARDAGVRAIVAPADITDRAQIDRVVQAALDEFGTIDVLANVAGIGAKPSLCDETDESIERVLAINLLGVARTMHAVLPVMKKQRRGAIVNVGSVAGEAGVIGIYSASKFGVRGLSDSVRREMRSYGVSVSLIEPGFVDTQMNAAMEGLPSPDIVAHAILNAVRRPRRRTIVPWNYHIPVFFATWLPGIIDLIFGDARIQERLNRDARAAAAAAASEERAAT